MKFASKLIFACVRLVCLLISVPGFPAEPAPAKRIPFDGKINPDAGARILIYDDGANRNPLQLFSQYGGAQAPPGTSAGAATAGTLLASLVIRGMNASKEHEDAVFRSQFAEAFAAVDTKKLLSEKITDALRSSGFQQIAVENVAGPADMAQPSLLIRIKEENILTLKIRYAIDPELCSLHFLVSAMLWKKDEVMPLYYTELQYSSPELKMSDLSDRRKKWLETNGALVVRSMQEGVDEVARMLSMELLSAERWKIADKPVSVNWRSPMTGKSMTTPFYTVEEKNDRTVGRPYSSDAAVLLSVSRE